MSDRGRHDRPWRPSNPLIVLLVLVGVVWPAVVLLVIA